MRPTWGSDSGRYQGGSWLPFNWYSIPVTRFLLFATVGVFLAYFFLGQDQSIIAQWVPFIVRGRGDLDWVVQFWRWFTYPFLELPSFWILFTLYALYWVGGTLERSWGSVNFAVLFAVFSAVGALAVGIGSVLLDRPLLFPLMGLSIPLISLITAWAALDPELDVSFWGLPVKAKFLAAVFVGLMYFQFGLAYRDPVLALFMLASPAFAFFYVRKLPRLSLGRGRPRDRWAPDLREERRPQRPAREEPRERVSGGLNPLRRRQEQAEIERLRKLLGEDDDDRPVRRN